MGTAEGVHPSPAASARGLGFAGLILLILATAAGFFVGQAGVPPIDRDEPRYTQATKQMVETGDYVQIRYQHSPRHKKPIGIHWLQAASVAVSGEGAAAPLWVYRVPSALGAIAAILLVAWAARAFLSPMGAWSLAALFGAMVIVGVEAHLAKTDAVLLATIVAAQGALARIWLGGRSWWLTFAFWIALGLGILVKGPIAPMVVVLTIIVLSFTGDRALFLRLRPLVGVLVVAAICLPWYIAIGVATDGDFYRAAIGRDFLGKATTGQEGHGAPPLTHIGFFLAVAWPLAPFTLAALWKIHKRRGKAFLFALAWALPAWIVFELVPTKLPHYTLPLIPAVALATFAALDSDDTPRWLRIVCAVLIVVVPLGVILAIPAGYVAFGTPIPWLAVAVAVVAAIAAVVAARAVLRGVPLLDLRVLSPTIAASIIAQAAVWGIALPNLSPVWVSPRLVAAAEAAAPCANPRLVSIGYNEPSFVFLSETRTALVPAQEAADILASECAVVATRAKRVDALRAAADERGLTLEEHAPLPGFNISKGDQLNLSIFTLAPGDRGTSATR